MLTQSIAKKRAAEAEKLQHPLAYEIPGHMRFKELVDVDEFHEEMQETDKRESLAETADDADPY